eukprot:3759381-Prymnesium_polylepis.1
MAIQLECKSLLTTRYPQQLAREWWLGKLDSPCAVPTDDPLLTKTFEHLWPVLLATSAIILLVDPAWGTVPLVPALVCAVRTFPGIKLDGYTHCELDDPIRGPGQSLHQQDLNVQPIVSSAHEQHEDAVVRDIHARVRDWQAGLSEEEPSQREGGQKQWSLLRMKFAPHAFRRLREEEEAMPPLQAVSPPWLKNKYKSSRAKLLLSRSFSSRQGARQHQADPAGWTNSWF